MNKVQDNPSLSPYVRWFMVIVALVVVFGGMLFFLPDLIGPRWPWPLTPFNTRFLGAVYLAELVIVVLLISHNQWAPGRLVLLMALSFTLIVSLVSLLYPGNFNWQRRVTWLWFFLYVASAGISAYFVWLYRFLPPAKAVPTLAPWRRYLQGQGVVLGLYGLGLLIAPAHFSSFWPWPLDNFHGQLYSAIFISSALGALIVWRSAAPIEWLSLGLGQATLGLSAILGLVIADASAHRVNWSLSGTWLWTGTFAVLMILGLGMVWQAAAVNQSIKQGSSTHTIS